jgi:putative signal transducing protein
MDVLVTVFESGDAVLLTMAKAALDSAGIRYVEEGQGIQDLFGVVTAENAERARQLLVGLKE